VSIAYQATEARRHTPDQAHAVRAFVAPPLHERRRLEEALSAVGDLR
jgi:hypothetical protein